MTGWVKYLGFALPISIMLNGIGGAKNGARDAYPRLAQCGWCKRSQPQTFLVGFSERVCKVCLEHARRYAQVMAVPLPRPLDWTPEVVADAPHKLTPLDPWWERQFA